MKICITTPKLIRTDGQARVNLELAQYLARAGHKLRLISTNIDPELLAEPGVCWHQVAIPGWARGALLKDLAFAAGARRILAREATDADILQLNNGDLGDFQADVTTSHFVHASWLKSPFHASRHFKGAYALYQFCYSHFAAALERRAYRTSGRMVAVSKLVRDNLITDVGTDPVRTQVILNGVDTAEFRPLAAGEQNMLRAELNLPDDVFLVILTGDIKLNRKNPDLVMQAVSRLDGRVHLALLGSTNGSPYPALAERLGIAHRVHFLGFRQDVRLLLRGADAFALPAHYDPFSLAVLEAMACGLPVVVTPSVGCSAMLDNGENGFVLASDDDIAGMTAVLAELSSRPDLARSVGCRGRLLAEQLSWQTMACQYEALYEEILRERQPQPLAVRPVMAASKAVFQKDVAQ